MYRKVYFGKSFLQKISVWKKEAQFCDSKVLPICRWRQCNGNTSWWDGLSKSKQSKYTVWKTGRKTLQLIRLETQRGKCQSLQHFIQTSDESQDVRPWTHHSLAGKHGVQMQRARTKLNTLEHWCHFIQRMKHSKEHPFHKTFSFVFRDPWVVWWSQSWSCWPASH